MIAMFTLVYLLLAFCMIFAVLMIQIFKCMEKHAFLSRLLDSHSERHRPVRWTDVARRTRDGRCADRGLDVSDRTSAWRGDPTARAFSINSIRYTVNNIV